MQSEKQAMSHSNLPYHHNAERLPLRHTRGGNLMLGKVVELQKSEQDISSFGCPNTPMLRLGGVRVISTSTALLCPTILGDRWKAMNLYITGMASRMITGLRTLSYSSRMFIEGKWNALIAERSLQ